MYVICSLRTREKGINKEGRSRDKKEKDKLESVWEV